MLINLENAIERVNNSNNLLNKLIEHKKTGDLELTNSERVNIRVDSHILPMNEVAEKYGVSRRTVNHIKAGIHSSSHNTLDKEVLDESEEKLKNVRSEALDKLMLALGLLSNENLRGQKARDLASIAANLSRVASNTGERTNNVNAVQVVVYAPRQKDVSDFQVVEVSR